MRALRTLLLLAMVAVLAAGGWLYWFAHHPIEPPATPFEFTVHSGASVKSVSRQLAREGLLAEGESLWILARLTGKAALIQAGTYRLERPLTPLELLDKLRRGDVVMVEMVFIEGTTLRQWLSQLASEARVKHTLAGKAEDLKAALGIAEGSPEGWFFPDTYRFAPGVSDVDILKRAHAAMRKRLTDAWEGRDPDIPIASPYQALVLASIIEKETAVPEERPLVASVFMNRLRRGMRLQTDPTVIYGMGESYEGNIRKKDLVTDTPWNTYTRDGLPPTPIAMPGLGALRAAVQPAKSDYLYFVARGDGSHQFSASLEEHNRAVAKFQLHR
jgi:peptidoglycan lytic transglycosylase G